MMQLSLTNKGDNMQKRCVYIWVNDNTHEPFYVGCGTHSRAKTTKWSSRTKAFYEVFNNNPCHYVIVKDNLTASEAAELERVVIKDYRDQGIELVNQTNGGEIRQFSEWTEEMRKEYSQRLTGENNPNFGHTWTDEMKARLSKERIAKGLAKGGLNPRATPVMCVETGTVYACKEDASGFLGVASACSSIYFCLKDPKRVAGKGRYHFVGKDMFDELNTEEKRKEWLRKIASKGQFPLGRNI